jgi:CSLREA domain-containing protein
MRPNRSKFSFHFFTLIALLTSLLSSAVTTSPAQAAGATLPVEQLLKPDGTLDLSTGYSGSLNNISNFSVSLDPARGPTFQPLAAPNVWNSLGSAPLPGVVLAITVSGADVYVGGLFVNAGGVADADLIAKFSDGAWSALGPSLMSDPDYEVNAIAVRGEDVYVGGLFTDAGGDPNADYIAKFSEGSWSALGAIPLNNQVHAIAVSGADVYAGGTFFDAGGDANADGMAKFSDGTWSALGSIPFSGAVHAIAVSGADVYVGGGFSIVSGDPIVDRIAKFSDGSWSALGSTPLNGTVSAIAVSGNVVYAGGEFTDAGGNANADYIAKFDNGAWSALGSTPLNSPVRAIAVSGTDVYVGGLFTNAGGVAAADYVAKFSGRWRSLGSTPLNSFVAAVAVSGADVYAGGQFFDAGGNSNADNVARFETPGATLTVNTSLDELSTNGNCSLREAIQAANTNTAVDACGAGIGADTIVFGNRLGPANIKLSNQFLITGSNGLTIDGGGDITINGLKTHRIFNVASNTMLKLNNLKLVAGSSDSEGGAVNIAYGGEVVISHSTLLNSTAALGGTIYNADGKLTFTNSTIADGLASQTAGAIYNAEGADTIIRNSTLSNNDHAGGDTNGGGVYVFNSSLTLINVIMANNQNGSECATHGLGSVITAKNTLIEALGEFPSTCGVEDGVDGNILFIDPNLGALTGSPAYFPLNDGSVAIDAGDDAVCAAAPVNNQSQNGLPRPQGEHCDIGSYER